MAARRCEVSLQVLKFRISKRLCNVLILFLLRKARFTTCYFSRVKIWFVLRDSSPGISLVFI